MYICVPSPQCILAAASSCSVCEEKNTCQI